MNKEKLQRAKELEKQISEITKNLEKIGWAVSENVTERSTFITVNMDISISTNHNFSEQYTVGVPHTDYKYEARYLYGSSPKGTITIRCLFPEVLK